MWVYVRACVCVCVCVYVCACVWVRVRACALARAGVHARAGTRVFIGFSIQKIRRTPFHPDENHRAKTV